MRPMGSKDKRYLQNFFTQIITVLFFFVDFFFGIVMVYGFNEVSLMWLIGLLRVAKWGY